MSDETTTEKTTNDGPDDDDLKELLAKRQHAKPNKLTWILLVLLVLALGFTMGSCVQKGVTSATSARTAPSFPDGAPAGAPSAASGETPAIAADPAGAIEGKPMGRGGLTIGTIESIDGATLTLSTPDGQTITVDVPEGTSVTSSVEVSLGDLPVGSTVVIRGAKGEDGTITADSVSEGAGGFPGGGLRPAPAP
jgi:hypothetical protein